MGEFVPLLFVMGPPARRLRGEHDGVLPSRAKGGKDAVVRFFTAIYSPTSPEISAEEVRLGPI
ncbi:hypothetical protein ARTSIC4J27_325 [Pseudarthrobacter siccitolerans]|uniref:Uncharacterized protein n=1 Tax=Pseudarthrobacter siccitolerans TaxID=861266 RepID=A0A024GWS2_9MICC|nr:hypothetical protein ARTSIC4J27_325 [Pseudarthrobacter siccitolerans]